MKEQYIIKFHLKTISGEIATLYAIVKTTDMVNIIKTISRLKQNINYINREFISFEIEL